MVWNTIINDFFFRRAGGCTQARETIEQVKLEYQEDKYVNPALMWEMIKLKIREKSIRYAKSKRSRMLREEEQLESLVNNLQKDSHRKQKKRGQKNNHNSKKVRWKNKRVGEND